MEVYYWDTLLRELALVKEFDKKCDSGERWVKYEEIEGLQRDLLAAREANEILINRIDGCKWLIDAINSQEFIDKVKAGRITLNSIETLLIGLCL